MESFLGRALNYGKKRGKTGIVALTALANSACSSILPPRPDVMGLCRENGVYPGVWKTEFVQVPNRKEEFTPEVDEALNRLRAKYGDGLTKIITSSCISETVRKPLAPNDFTKLTKRFPELEKVPITIFKMLLEDSSKMTTFLKLWGYNDDEIERITILAETIKKEMAKEKICKADGVIHLYNEEPSEYDDDLLAWEKPAIIRMMKINGRKDFLWATGSDQENKVCDDQLTKCLNRHEAEPYDKFITVNPDHSTFGELHGQLPMCTPPQGVVPKETKITIEDKVAEAYRKLGLDSTANLVISCLSRTTYDPHQQPRNTGKLELKMGSIVKKSMWGLSYDRALSFASHPPFSLDGTYPQKFNEWDENHAAHSLYVCIANGVEKYDRKTQEK